MARDIALTGFFVTLSITGCLLLGVGYAQQQAAGDFSVSYYAWGVVGTICSFIGAVRHALR